MHWMGAVRGQSAKQPNVPNANQRRQRKNVQVRGSREEKPQVGAECPGFPRNS